MQYDQKKWHRQLGALSVMASIALGLAACGGGDDGSPPAINSGSNHSGRGDSDSDSGSGGNGGSGSGSGEASIRVAGTSKSVHAANGSVFVMTMPIPSNGYGTLEGSTKLGPMLASALTEAAPGAYTGFDTLKLTRGVVTDIAGNEQYAIGRWADGADSDGGQYNANQGRMWAVGTPLEKPTIIGPDTPMSCQLDAATQPIAIDGNTAPGKLNTANATIHVANGASKQKVVIDLDLGYSIGQDADQTFNAHDLAEGFTTSAVARHTIVIREVGTNENAPYLLVSYTFDAPTVGTISGMAALACTRQSKQS